ncbi:MAG: aldehyde dehydrogenase family protein [Candidatus Gracilibacteria bacterium]|nr:aldehyde dehydrogenase family protein [Candidatus Gracilibacteria bacterium]
MTKIQSINPYNLELNAEYELFSDELINEKISIAHDTFTKWKNTTFEERRVLFHKLADLIEADMEKYAKLQTIEMGMLYNASLSGMKSTVSLVRWYAENAQRILKSEEFTDNGTNGKYIYDPLGVIFGVGPWNFPYNQILRAAIANIIAGNTVVYKHASNVPMCAEQIEKFFLDAGFPIGVYTNLFISASKSEYVLANEYIRGVNLTGGEAAGRTIGALAGKYLKPSVLELGGNDAFVLLDHSDTAKIVAEATACRIANGGQKCNSSKRFIILEKHYDIFITEIGKYMSNLVIGDPMDAKTQIPPLAKQSLVQELDNQVQKSIEEGAILITGGKIIGDKGQFYAPTVLSDVTRDMTCYKQETFGPVLNIIKSTSIEDSIRIANDSDLGLSAVVYGDDIEQCKQVASKLEGGMIFINAPAGSKPHLPFGGVKNSGYGKENGPEGLKAFTNKKVVVY